MRDLVPSQNPLLSGIFERHHAEDRRNEMTWGRAVKGPHTQTHTQRKNFQDLPLNVHNIIYKVVYIYKTLIITFNF